ncbi:spore coat CotO family protein [Mesobacillus maritimus]|uniref:CotO family spore coat protein n=1 Tax=Mesobacillus maritimus TaxID=1643336 RepID=UPI002040EA31|nr:CotO family spore coat protein [Mesobacillus maritimus]MCM3586167.1 spore coat CotO family protein [Mesobacillus maritimus]MCM3667494.1 spore coat CotO family protein [Mesobacillus maritimus]
MSNRKTKHKPTLYISQPMFQFPKVIMQERYSTKEERFSEEQTTVKEEHLSPASKDTDIEPVEIEIASNQETEVESSSNPFDTKRKNHFTLQRVKHFREMTVAEKLAYLEHFPKQLNAVNCLYVLEDSTYTGVFIQNDNGLIEIKLSNGKNATLRQSEIKDIKMLGFH